MQRCTGAAKWVPRWCSGDCAEGAECRGSAEVLRFFRGGGAVQSRCRVQQRS